MGDVSGSDEGSSSLGTIPAWLAGTFADAVNGCGGSPSREVIEQEARALLSHWCAPDRAYHNAGYLARVIAAFDQLETSAHSPELLRLAVWYAGLIPPEAIKQNTAAVAEFEESCPTRISESIGKLGFSQAVAARVCELLHAVIGHDSSIDDVDATALIDATQYDLAATPQEYKRYRASLREEFSSLSDLEFFKARRRFVRMLLKRPQIFLSPAGAAWEATARQNLEAELANIEARIAKSDPGVPLDEDPADSSGVDLTSTTMIRRIEAAAAPVVPIKKDEDSEPAVHSTATHVAAPTAREEEAESDETSSLEAEPEDLTRSFAAPVRRLSAKELARLARKSKETQAAESDTGVTPATGVEDSFTGADAKELRKQLDED